MIHKLNIRYVDNVHDIDNAVNADNVNDRFIFVPKMTLLNFDDLNKLQ